MRRGLGNWYSTSVLFPKRRLNGYEIAPDEIFLDSSNLPGRDDPQFEARVVRPLGNRAIASVGIAFIAATLVFAARSFELGVVHGKTTARAEGLPGTPRPLRRPRLSRGLLPRRRVPPGRKPDPACFLCGDTPTCRASRTFWVSCATPRRIAPGIGGARRCSESPGPSSPSTTFSRARTGR